MQPTTVVAIVTVLSLTSVKRGGRTPLMPRTGEGKLGQFCEQSFGSGRAGTE
jgi:hypothetical protein